MPKEVWVFEISLDKNTSGEEHEMFDRCEIEVQNQLERHGYKGVSVYISHIENPPVRIFASNSESIIK